MDRLAILAPILTPYRLPIYEALGRVFELTVLYARAEDNRPGWTAALLQPGASFRVRQSWGLIFKRPRRHAGRVFEYRYLQFTPGYWLDLMRLRAAAVISVEMGPRSLMALAWGALCGVPVWLWIGETRHSARGAGSLRRWLRRHVFARHARHFISFGRSTTEYLTQDLGIAPARIVQIQNSIDAAMFDPTRAMPVADFAPHPVLLHVGQMLPRKGIAPLLQAAATLQAEGLSFTLLMVGGGEGLPEAADLARRLGLRDCHFVGAQPAAAMAGWYAACDLVVFATLEDVWGLVANEAIQMGKPLLCSRYAGCADEIVPAPCRFDPLDPADFASALRRGLRGEVPPIEPAVLRPAEHSARAIADAVAASIRRAG